MGSVAAEAQLPLDQSVFMNFWVYAGASQLAAIDLMKIASPIFVVVLTGLIINLRFILYSASMATHLRDRGFFTKLLCSYWLTDQTYALMTANEHKFKNSDEYVQFFLGGSVCMMIAWHGACLLGFLFGNFAPKEWSLDFAVPLSFVVLVAPALKNRKQVAVAVFASVASILFYTLPFRMGLITTVVCAMALGAFLNRKSRIA